MPAFIVSMGGTLDGLGEPPPAGEEPSVVESVMDFIVIFLIVGIVSGVAGFAMVTLWTLAGERQVRKCFLRLVVGRGTRIGRWLCRLPYSTRHEAQHGKKWIICGAISKWQVGLLVVILYV